MDITLDSLGLDRHREGRYDLLEPTARQGCCAVIR